VATVMLACILQGRQGTLCSISMRSVNGLQDDDIYDVESDASPEGRAVCG
jgi:hypothetical protein